MKLGFPHLPVAYANVTPSTSWSKQPKLVVERKSQRTKISELKEKNGWNENPPKLHQRLWHHRWKLCAIPLFTPKLITAQKKPSPAQLSLAGLIGGILLLLEREEMSYSDESIEKFSPDNMLIAMHEIGHFLNDLFYKSAVVSVELTFHPNNQNIVLGGMLTNQKGSEAPLLNVLEGGYGGKAMEQLLKGYYNRIACFGDTTNNLGALKFSLLNYPKETFLSLDAIINRDLNAIANIVKFPKALVEELAKTLIEDRVWDEKRVNEIIETYNLNEIAHPEY